MAHLAALPPAASPPTGRAARRANVRRRRPSSDATATAAPWQTGNNIRHFSATLSGTTYAVMPPLNSADHSLQATQ